MKRILLIAVMTTALLVPAGASASPKAPHLSYARAKSAIQHRADRFAGTRTKVTSMFLRLDKSYSAQAEWKRENPTGCSGCGYDPVSGQFYDTATTESCSVDLRAKLLPSRRIRVSVEDFACY